MEKKAIAFITDKGKVIKRITELTTLCTKAIVVISPCAICAISCAATAAIAGSSILSKRPVLKATSECFLLLPVAKAF